MALIFDDIMSLLGKNSAGTGLPALTPGAGSPEIYPTTFPGGNQGVAALPNGLPAAFPAAAAPAAAWSSPKLPPPGGGGNPGPLPPPAYDPNKYWLTPLTQNLTKESFAKMFPGVRIDWPEPIPVEPKKKKGVA